MRGCSEHVGWGLLPLSPLAWPLCPPCATPGLHIPQQLGRCLPGRTLARKKHAAPSLQELLSVCFSQHCFPLWSPGQAGSSGPCSEVSELPLLASHGPDTVALLGSFSASSSSFSTLCLLPAPHPHQGAPDGRCRVLEGGWSTSRVPEALSWEGSSAPMTSDSPKPHCSNTILLEPH